MNGNTEVPLPKSMKTTLKASMVILHEEGAKFHRQQS